MNDFKKQFGEGMAGGPPPEEGFEEGEEEEEEEDIPPPAPAMLSKEELSQLPAGELRKMLQQKGISTKGLMEKSEFVDKVFETQGPYKAPE